MSHANCLTHRFCAEFLHGSCNITFIRLPTLENLERGISVCATHGHTLANCKTYDRHNKSEKQAVYFLENTAFFLTERNCIRETGAYTFRNIKASVNRNFSSKLYELKEKPC